MPHMATLIPDLVPDVTYYQVLDDLGELGRVWREVPEHYSEEDVTRDILTGQFDKPIMVVAFNLAVGSARDVSEDVATALASRARRQGSVLRTTATEFYERATGRDLPADLLSVEAL